MVQVKDEEGGHEGGEEEEGVNDLGDEEKQVIMV